MPSSRSSRPASHRSIQQPEPTHTLKQLPAIADLLFGFHAKKERRCLTIPCVENPQLLALLTHYAQQGTEDRPTWRDRLMEIEGVEAKELSALHGSLMAFDWIEQNTGQALSACYRITLNGLREYRRIYGVEVEEEAPGKPRFPKRKKQKSDSPEAVALAVAASE